MHRAVEESSLVGGVPNEWSRKACQKSNTVLAPHEGQLSGGELPPSATGWAGGLAFQRSGAPSQRQTASGPVQLNRPAHVSRKQSVQLGA